MASTSSTPSYFPTYALDQAFCGIGAGIVSTMCMHPLDLVKVHFQVATAAHPQGPLDSAAPVASTSASTATAPRIDIKGKGKAVPSSKSPAIGIYHAVKRIAQRDGLKGLYRGLTPNLTGNAASWGFYFLWYTMIKARMQQWGYVSARKGDSPSSDKLSPAEHLAASATAGIITAVITNPLWVVKTRMFTTTANNKHAYRNVLDGLYRLGKEEGIRGLGKGMTLAIIGVSNGAIQFMTYEELKRWRMRARRKRLGPNADEQAIKELSNVEYILTSGSAKLVAIGITYPYQVIRSRIQYQPPMDPYKSIPDCVRRTFRADGFTGFYKGLGTNAVRILPGTCVTFVVYEQLSRMLERNAIDRSGGG